MLAQGALTERSAAQLPVQLSGSLHADPESIEAGQYISLGYTITNEGAVLQVDLQVTEPEGVSGSFERQVTLPAGLTLNGSFHIHRGPDTGCLHGQVAAASPRSRRRRAFRLSQSISMRHVSLIRAKNSSC